MRTLYLNIESARRMYKSAPFHLNFFKRQLEKTLSRKTFKPVHKRIKSYKDACIELGLNPNDIPKVSEFIPIAEQKAIIAFYKLIIIVRALNEEWKPDWKDCMQEKWYPVFKRNDNNGQFEFDCAKCISIFYTELQNPMICKSHEIATYFGKQFSRIWKDYLLH